MSTNSLNACRFSEIVDDDVRTSTAAMSDETSLPCYACGGSTGHVDYSDYHAFPLCDSCHERYAAFLLRK